MSIDQVLRVVWCVVPCEGTIVNAIALPTSARMLVAGFEVLRFGGTFPHGLKG